MAGESWEMAGVGLTPLSLLPGQHSSPTFCRSSEGDTGVGGNPVSLLALPWKALGYCFQG